MHEIKIKLENYEFCLLGVVVNRLICEYYSMHLYILKDIWGHTELKTSKMDIGQRVTNIFWSILQGFIRQNKSSIKTSELEKIKIKIGLWGADNKR